ncbi:MAG: hypothetical protein K9K79_03235 [Desulfohalobiaceae bacterium]|nr:hypothetical protein [Desulfohalobiaceae bacterium]
MRAGHVKTVRYVNTEPAGENLCSSANLMTDNEGSAAGGFGSVLGAKKLNAVAVIGSGKPQVANPERLLELNKEAVYLNRHDPMVLPFACTGQPDRESFLPSVRPGLFAAQHPVGLFRKDHLPFSFFSFFRVGPLYHV